MLYVYVYVCHMRVPPLPHRCQCPASRREVHHHAAGSVLPLLLQAEGGGDGREEAEQGERRGYVAVTVACCVNVTVGYSVTVTASVLCHYDSWRVVSL